MSYCRICKDYVDSEMKATSVKIGPNKEKTVETKICKECGGVVYRRIFVDNYNS